MPCVQMIKMSSINRKYVSGLNGAWAMVSFHFRPIYMFAYFTATRAPMLVPVD